MTTDARKDKKRNKRAAKRAVQAVARDNKGWTRVQCQGICGCCISELWYTSRERAEEACRKATNCHASMKDDRGNTDEVDGFYGFDIKEF